MHKREECSEEKENKTCSVSALCCSPSSKQIDPRNVEANPGELWSKQEGQKSCLSFDGSKSSSFTVGEDSRGVSICVLRQSSKVSKSADIMAPATVTSSGRAGSSSSSPSCTKADEVESFYQQLWHIPWNLDRGCPRTAPIKHPRAPVPRVPRLPPPLLPQERAGLCCLGVEEEGFIEEPVMAERGRGRGRGGAGRGDWQANQQQPPPQQPMFNFNQMQQPFPFPPQAYGFMPGGMPPPPWGFGGPFPPYPPPQFGGQSNQWIAPNQGGNQGQGQLAGEGNSKNKSQGNKTAYKKKLVANKEPESQLIPLSSLNYADTVCLCCGEPGHGKGSCSKQQFCFICKAGNHVDDECPVLKRPHQMAKYIGSSATGLGFYHIETPETVVNPISSTKNCGVVAVEEGEISKEELAKEFSNIYKTNWPWQIRELGDWSYLVKFPPHISVDQVIGYPRFGLAKEGTTVSVTKWSDDPEPVETLAEVWMQIRGLLPP
jgi:hypothetical protein